MIPMPGHFNLPIVYTFLALLSLSSCRNEETTPKPRGYYRISFPDKAYRQLNGPFPYNFRIPVYATVTPDLLNPAQKEWITVEIPANHAQIHISYKKIDHNLPLLIEEARSLVYKHSQKASSIEEQIFLYPAKKTFGTLYTLKGNAASPMQFYLTDSVNHFLRGALYIKEVPNYDSLRPVIKFLSEDVIKMIESTEWKTSHGH
jgi:gliding motility-associated lipoprotein GldD